MNESVLENPQEQEWNFYIDGVRCAKCVQKLETLPLDHTELLTVQFNKSQNLLSLKSHQKISPQVIMNWIQQLGYKAYFVENLSETHEHLKRDRRQWLLRLAVTFFFASNLMMFSLALYFGAMEQWRQLFQWLCGLLYLPILFYSAIPFYQSAWQATKAKRFSADLAIVIAFLWGSLLSYFNLIRGNSEFYFDSTSSFIFLILLARYFLFLTQNKIESDLNPSLLFKTKPVFKTQQNNITRNKLYHEIEPNEVVILQTHQTLPADLILEDDQAYMDTSLFSGESMPQLFKRGDELKAGMIALSNETRGRVTQAFGKSELHQIFEGILLHRNEKTKAHSRAEVYSQYLLLIVSVLSIGVLLLFGLRSDWSEGFRRALALFTIACPCSLALSIPLASLITLKKAIENGLYVKTPLYFEKLRFIKGVIFDKTGTLTQGQMTFHSWDPEIPDETTLGILLAMEQKSHHPLAKSLTRYLLHELKPSIQPVKLDQIQEILGVGVEAQYQGNKYSISSIKNPKHQNLVGFELNVINQSSQEISDDSSQKHHTLCRAYFKDPLRAEAQELIDFLQKNKFEIHILSGDRPDVVESLAQELNIPLSHVHSQLTPSGKAQFVEQIQLSNKNNLYLMVGDGHNDALALSKSSVSLAITGCAETSLRAADAYAQQGGLYQIDTSLKISAYYHRLIKQNLGLSLAYNFIAGNLAMAGYIDPLIAAILMPLNSFIVIGATVFAKAPKAKK